MIPKLAHQRATHYSIAETLTGITRQARYGGSTPICSRHHQSERVWLVESSYRLVLVLIPTLDEDIYVRVSPASDNKPPSEKGICRPEIAVALLLDNRDGVHSGTETVTTNRGGWLAN